MKVVEGLKKTVLVIAALSMVFTMSFGMVGTARAYAAVQERVFEPEDEYYEDYILKGTDVPVKDARIKALIEYNILTGGTRFKGTNQCWGYAEKVRRMFGTGGRRTSVQKKTSAKVIFETLRKVRPGTHVRFGYSKTQEAHSIAVYKVTKDKMYFSDGNWDSNNCIRHMVVDIDYFTRYPYLNWYIQPTGGFTVSKTSAKGISYENENKNLVVCQPVTGAKNYTIYKSTSKKGKYTPIATTTKPYYLDKKARVGATWYKIKPNNKSITAPTVVYNKVKTPTIRVNATKAGYSKLTWDAMKGAKKYGIYKTYYDKNYNLKYKRIATVTGTSYIYKGSLNDLAVKALASNSKADSNYNEIYVEKVPPQPVITSIEQDASDNNKIKITLKIPYSCKKFDNIYMDVFRSDSKNGEYTYLTGCDVYGNDDSMYKKSAFDYKTAVLTAYDEDWKSNTTYYYKAVVYGYSTTSEGWYTYQQPGLDSKIVSFTTPERPVIEVKYGDGTLYKYSDGTPIKYVDPQGIVHTEGLELNWWDELIYEYNGTKYMVETDGSLYYYDPSDDTWHYIYDDSYTNNDAGRGMIAAPEENTEEAADIEAEAATEDESVAEEEEVSETSEETVFQTETEPREEAIEG